MITGITLPVKGVTLTSERIENGTDYIEKDIDEEIPNNEYSDTGNSLEETREGSTISPLKKDEISVYANNSYDAENYFEASASSTNDHYLIKGFFMKPDGTAYIVLYLQKNNTVQPITNIYVSEDNITDEDEINGFQVDVINQDTNLTINLPGNNKKVLTNNNGFIVINIGKLDKLTEKFHFTIISRAHGWDINDVAVTIKIEYEILKTVNKQYSTIGDEIIYTVTVKNFSDIPLYGIDVTDAIPAGLDIKSVNGSTNYTIHDNVLTLDNDITLAKDQTKTYTIIATVSKDVESDEIINTATMKNNSIIPKSAQAIVKINNKNVIVKKIITGNMGEVSKKFNFTANAYRNDAYNKNYTFDLAHNEEYILENLPDDAVLTLSETNIDGYKVKVTINGIEQIAEEGKYKIELKNYDNLKIVVNNHKDVIIDTGVTIDSLPYLIILLVVVIGGSLFLINKRKQEN